MLISVSWGVYSRGGLGVWVQGETQTGNWAAPHHHGQQELLLLSGHCDVIRRRQHNRYVGHTKDRCIETAGDSKLRQSPILTADSLALMLIRDTHQWEYCANKPLTKAFSALLI